MNQYQSDNQSSFEALMTDADLVQLCDLQRTSDEVLDVINLTENQHSDILAWMLDAREGHGQGDKILRDFLVTCSSRAASPTCHLDPKSSTARFFSKWPPSRLRTTALGSAFVARELGYHSRERVDLFIIDTQNKFIILVENKAGTSHSVDQLRRYQDSFRTTIVDHEHLTDYEVAYLALDYDLDMDNAEPRPASGDWLHINYDWLKVSADRALAEILRGNAAAQLVASYCKRQTAWTNPVQLQCLRLAARLHLRHPEPTSALVALSDTRLEKAWLRNEHPQSEYLLFALQNQGVIALLKATRGIEAVRLAIMDRIPALLEDNLYASKRKLDICPVGWDRFEGNDYWPVFMEVEFEQGSERRYRIKLCWAPQCSPDELTTDKLVRWLRTINEDFAVERPKRLVVAKDVEMDTLIDRVYTLNERMKLLLGE